MNDSCFTHRYQELTGRVAVVTGAARGIGWGITQRLIAEGMNVVMGDKDQDALTKAVASLTSEPNQSAPDAKTHRGSVAAVEGDLAHPDMVNQLFEQAERQFDRVDLLVNNAADLRRSRTLTQHHDLLDAQLASNIVGPYLCSQRAAQTMANQGSGVIVNISSVGGVQAHHRGLPYDVTKGAIDAMTRAMAVDLGPLGIRVNGVAPGVTVTKPSASMEPASPKAALIPLRRIGTVQDIAATVAFLASDESSYITGQVIYVDGGITAQLAPEGTNEL